MYINPRKSQVKKERAIYSYLKYQFDPALVVPLFCKVFQLETVIK